MKPSSRKPKVTRKPLPAFSPEGVDLTLIRWMLSLTPRQRLIALQNNVNAILRLRNARLVK